MSNALEEKNLYHQLVESLRLVASSYDVQVASLPHFVHKPDEIALTFDDAYLTAPSLREDNLITEEILDMLNELSNLFHKMSDDKSFWTLEKLKTELVWQKARELARTILEKLKEPLQKPDLGFITWIE